MATQRTIPKAEWKTFFNQMTHALQGKRAEIEVAALDLGDQVVAGWIPLIGMTYDDHDDLLDVALSGLDHLIRQPREIVVVQGSHGIETVGVMAGDGTRQVVRLKTPLMLPSATV